MRPRARAPRANYRPRSFSSPPHDIITRLGGPPKIYAPASGKTCAWTHPLISCPPWRLGGQTTTRFEIVSSVVLWGRRR